MDGRADGRLHLARRKDPPPSCQRIDGGPGEGRRPTDFEIPGVGSFVHDDLIAGVAVDTDRNLIAHGARGQKDRILFAQEFTDHRHKLVDGGILAHLLVANRCPSNELTHCWCGPGNGVAE